MKHVSQHKYPFHSPIGNKRRQRRLLYLRGHQFKHTIIVVFLKTFHSTQIKCPLKGMLRLDQIVCNQNSNRSGLFASPCQVSGPVAHMGGSLCREHSEKMWSNRGWLGTNRPGRSSRSLTRAKNPPSLGTADSLKFNFTVLIQEQQTKNSLDISTHTFSEKHNIPPLPDLGISREINPSDEYVLKQNFGLKRTRNLWMELFQQFSPSG